MARTALTVTTLTPNNSLVAATGTTGTTDGHFINCPPEQLLLRVVVATAETDVTIKAGDSPPALSSLQGDLVKALPIGTHWIGPFSSARFVQTDATPVGAAGGLFIDYETPANVVVTALRMPRNA